MYMCISALHLPVCSVYYMCVSLPAAASSYDGQGGCRQPYSKTILLGFPKLPFIMQLYEVCMILLGFPNLQFTRRMKFVSICECTTFPICVLKLFSICVLKPFRISSAETSDGLFCFSSSILLLQYWPKQRVPNWCYSGITDNKQRHHNLLKFARNLFPQSCGRKLTQISRKTAENYVMLMKMAAN